MTTYNIAATPAVVYATPATLLKIGFGSPAQNTEMVKEVQAMLAGMELNGKLVLLNGPASLPVAVVLAHKLVHVFGAIGVFDPKLNGYVVSASHDPQFELGQLIPAADVQS